MGIPHCSEAGSEWRMDADTYAARSAFLILKPNETGHTSLVEATRPGNLA